MESGSDNSLMLRVCRGDVDKLGSLFERHKNALFGYFYRVTRDAEVSEDLVQNVFLRILKYRSQFAGYGRFSTWMYHIAHNVCADHYKDRSATRDVADLPGATQVDCETAEKRMLADERLQMIEEALFRLSSDQREILVLSRYHGMKYREIGRMLGCSEGAVKVRVFRALMSLKLVYAELEG
jgi:RNA polymerase sigma-70 factor (ECF subfamily)